MKHVIIASDKSGFTLKEAVKAHLAAQGYEVVDCGTQDTENAMPYYEAAATLSPRIQSGEFQRGILICGTGMGMSIVANTFRGVYAAVCESTYSAEKARAINNANVLAMGGWMIGEVLGCEMADVFLRTAFTQGLEEWRQANIRKFFERVQEIEAQNEGEASRR